MNHEMQFLKMIFIPDVRHTLGSPSWMVARHHQDDITFLAYGIPVHKPLLATGWHPATGRLIQVIQFPGWPSRIPYLTG